MKIVLRSLFVSTILLSISACAMGGMYSAPQMATPQQMAAIAPQPIQGNSGEYMLPFTSDDVLAEWVSKTVDAAAGEQIGGAVGSYAGQKVAENIPFIGGWLGQKAGETLGREAAVLAAGGEDFIRDTSDLSFNSLSDLAIYMYATYSSNPNYADALGAVQSIYPSLKTEYYNYIIAASRRAIPVTN